MTPGSPFFQRSQGSRTLTPYLRTPPQIGRSQAISALSPRRWLSPSHSCSRQDKSPVWGHGTSEVGSVPPRARVDCQRPSDMLMGHIKSGPQAGPQLQSPPNTPCPCVPFWSPVEWTEPDKCWQRITGYGLLPLVLESMLRRVLLFSPIGTYTHLRQEGD